MTLLESFSKLVERREAVKLYVYMCVAHTRAIFVLLSSLEYLCVPAQAHALETGTGYTWLLEIDSRAGATLHVCQSHSFVKLPVSSTV